MDEKFIQDWSNLNIDEKIYSYLLDKVSEELLKGHELTETTFNEILDWKSSRTKGYIKKEEYKVYSQALKEILSLNDYEKLKELKKLYGFGIPIASTFLHFIYPNEFPIIDRRVIENLRNLGYLDNSRKDSYYLKKINGYLEYREKILNIKNKLKNWSLHQIDNALFKYQKLKLDKKIDIY